MIEVCLAERQQPFISGVWGNYRTRLPSPHLQEASMPDVPQAF